MLTESPIRVLEAAKREFAVSFSKAPIVEPDDGLYLRALENLSDRLFELCESMLVCLATGVTAGVEPLARAVVEGSVNLAYISDSNHKERLFAFFFQYLKEHKRKLDEWGQHVRKTGEDPRTLSAIQSREAWRSGMFRWIDQMRSDLGVPAEEELLNRWPKSFFRRCESLGKAETYLTSYHRLSAGAHVSAEDTLGYLFGYYLAATSQNHDAFERICAEAVAYSAVMARIAIIHYIDSSSTACEAVRTSVNSEALNRLKEELVGGIEELAPAAGVPGTNPKG